MTALSIVRALHDFKTSVAGDLNFKAGDLLLVLSNVDQQWLHGEGVDGNKGMFPRSFVYEEQLPPLQPGETILIATSDFYAQTGDDLTIHRGDVIAGKRKVDENWWFGECANKRGIFPSCFVRAVQLGSRNFEEAQLPAHGTVKAPLKAQLPGEIDLERGDRVVVDEFVDQWWCRGVVRNQRGFIPRAFVELDDNTSAKQPANQKAYGMSKFKFDANYPGELSFGTGQRLELVGHVDNEWVLCKLNDKTGIAPTSYLNIIIDCPVLSHNELSSAIAAVQGRTTTGLHSPLNRENTAVAANWVDKTFRVTHQFKGRSAEELSVAVDDYVRIRRVVDDKWLEGIVLKSQRAGLIPFSILAPISATSPTAKQPSVENKVDNAIARSLLSLELDTKVQQPPTQHRVPILPVVCGSRSANCTPPPRPKTQPSVAPPTTGTAWLPIFRDLLHSEREYLDDLNRLYTACGAYSDRLGLKEVTEKLSKLLVVTRALVSNFELVQTSPALPALGKVFENFSDELTTAYRSYNDCQERWTEQLCRADSQTTEGVKAMLARCQGSRSYRDVADALNQPARRILKYPIYLAAFIKFSDPTTASVLEKVKQRFTAALRSMNESKHCVDLVHKYREQCRESFAQRLSKFSLHSVMKKSSRLGVRLSSSLGLTQLPSDAEFETCQKIFQADTKRIRSFLQHVSSTIAKAESTVNAHHAMVEAVRPIGSAVNGHPSFLAVLNQLKQDVKVQVQIPVGTLQSRAKLLAKLVEKRQDKLLDCEAAEARLQKANKAADRVRVNAQRVALSNARGEYGAMNRQMIDELTKYHAEVLESLRIAQNSFALVTNRFTGRLAKELQGINGTQQSAVKNEISGDRVSLISFCENSSALLQSSENPGLLGSMDDTVSLVPKVLQSSHVVNKQPIFTPPPLPSPLLPIQPQSFENQLATVDLNDSASVVSPSSPSSIAADYDDNIDEFCRVVYDFCASTPDELSLEAGQLVVVHSKCDMQANSEWWLVENELGDFGYVPAAYLESYTVF